MSTKPGYNFITVRGTTIGQDTPPTTNRLLIIGTAVDGPINQPIRITNTQTAEKIFGPAKYANGYKDPDDVVSGKRNGATLPLAVKEALRAGATDVWLCRATGTKAANSTAFSSYFDMEAIYAGDIYNDVSLTMATGTGSATGTVTFTLSQPAVKGGDVTIALPVTTTVEETILRINDHPDNTTLYIDPLTFPTTLTDTLADMSDGTESLSGGANQTDAPGEALATSKALFATKLVATDTGTFDMLLGDRFQFNHAVLAGLYIDDEVVNADASASIYEDFTAWIEQMSKVARPCMGWLACRPTGIKDVADLITYVNTSLLATTAGYYDEDANHIKAGPFLNEGNFITDVNGNSIDLGGRVVVTAGTDVIWSHPDVGRYLDSFHIWAAAKSTVLPPEQSLQYTPCDTCLGFANRLPGKYADLLAAGIGADEASLTSGKGAYMVLIPNFRNPNGPRVIYDDSTSAFRNSPFRQAQLVDLINSIHVDVYDRLINYIGKPTSLSTQAAMKADIKAVLDGYVESGGLRGGEGLGYSYDLEIRGTDQDLGIVRVNLSVHPSTSIRAIVQTITVMRNA